MYKPKCVLIFKYSVLTSKKTQPINITKVNWLMLFKGCVFFEARTEYLNITKINWLMLFKGITAVYSEKVY
jgi:hypothetical protein